LLILGILLFIQFWLGMSKNLFIMVPLSMPFNFLSYSGGVEVLAHVVNGVLVLAFAIFVLGFGVKLKISIMSKLSALGIVFVMLAIVNGFLFTFSGQNDGFSAGMAMSFLSVYTV
jgi:hypothetical protein